MVTSRAFVDQAKPTNSAALEGVALVYLEDLREQVGLGDKLWLMAWAIHRPRAFERPTSPETAAVVLFHLGFRRQAQGASSCPTGPSSPTSPRCGR